MIGTVLSMLICVAEPDTFQCAGPEREIQVSVEMPVKVCEQQAQMLLPQIMQAFPNNVVRRYKCYIDNGHKKIDI